MWSLAALVSSACCFVRAVIDFRRGKHAWGVVGVICGAIIASLLIPIGATSVCYKAFEFGSVSE